MARVKVDNKFNVVIGTKAQVEGDTSIPENSIIIVTDEVLIADDIPALSITKITDFPTIPTVPTISTDIETDGTSDIKTTSPKAVKTYVDNTIEASGENTHKYRQVIHLSAESSTRNYVLEFTVFTTESSIINNYTKLKNAINANYVSSNSGGYRRYINASGVGWGNIDGTNPVIVIGIKQVIDTSLNIVVANIPSSKAISLYDAKMDDFTLDFDTTVYQEM